VTGGLGPIRPGPGTTSEVLFVLQFRPLRLHVAAFTVQLKLDHFLFLPSIAGIKPCLTTQHSY
jgi:hypothetical protein